MHYDDQNLDRLLSSRDYKVDEAVVVKNLSVRIAYVLLLVIRSKTRYFLTYSIKHLKTMVNNMLQVLIKRNEKNILEQLCENWDAHGTHFIRVASNDLLMIYSLPDLGQGRLDGCPGHLGQDRLGSCPGDLEQDRPGSCPGDLGHGSCPRPEQRRCLHIWLYLLMLLL